MLCCTILILSVSDNPALNREIDEGKDKIIKTERGDIDEEDGPWYLGKAREEFKKRRTEQVPNHQGEEDAVQVCFMIKRPCNY